MSNPTPPYNSQMDETDPKTARLTGRLSPVWLMWFNKLFLYLSYLVDYTSAVLLVPVTGFSYTIVSQVTTLNPLGTLATGTLIMPKSPFDGQTIEVGTTQTITGLTVSPNAGQTVYNAPTTLIAGSGFAYYYRQATNTWYRRY